MKQTLAITGANSYIGHHLVREALRQGFEVRALTRKKSRRCLETFADKIEFFDFDLEAGCPDEALEGIDTLMHLAWYRPGGTRLENDREINFEGTRKLLALARKCRVSKRIFVSSQLASPKAQSFYGRNKFAVESLWEDEMDLIVRTGYVFGGTPFGFYEKTLENFARSRWMPIIRKKAPLHPIHVEDLVRILLKMTGDPHLEGNRIYSVGSERPIFLADFFRLLGRCCFQKEMVLLPLPAYPLFAVAFLLGYLHKAFNDLSERLGGILSTQVMETEKDLKDLEMTLTATEAFIRNGFHNALKREGRALSQYLFGNVFHGLVGQYVQSVQTYPYSKPLPLPRLCFLCPFLIGMMEPIALLKKNGLIRAFQKRIEILIVLKEKSDIGNKEKGKRPLLPFLWRLLLISIRETFFFPFRLWTHLAFLTRSRNDA